MYFKTETGSDKIPLKPGQKSTEKIDGIRVGNTVIKVTDGYTKVVVNNNGTVNIYYNNPGYSLYYDWKGGELTSPPDAGWNPIFNKK